MLSMPLVRFKEECLGVAASIVRMFGISVAEQIAADYVAVADIGGNDELGVCREEGVSFNPRIARILSIVIQDGEVRDLRGLRVAIYSALPAVSPPLRALPAELAHDVEAIQSLSPTAAPWLKGIALSLVLDRVRHLHMTTMDVREREAYVRNIEASHLLAPTALTPEGLRLKVLHALALQHQRLRIDAQG